MRSLEAARARARECRAQMGEEQDGLLGRLQEHLTRDHGVRIHAVSAAFLDGGQGEIDTSGPRPRLNYDRVLDSDPARKLELFAHEYGHLIQHHRLTRDNAPFDILAGSAYLGEGAAALTRYNPHAREEAEATAFAVEFVCPADRVFERWRSTPGATAQEIAQAWGLRLELVQAQLAEGLHRFVAGVFAPDQAPRPESLTNPEQEEAATLTGVPVLVDAGPGTGKTKTLVRRIAHLLTECKHAPEHLLVLTFSREAADELRERIARALEDEAVAARIEIATFHEFGVKLLYEHGHHLGLPESVRIIDEHVQREIVNRVLGRARCDAILKLKNLEETASEAARHITYLKDRLYTPESLAAQIPGDPGHPEDEAVAQAWALHSVFAEYEAEKRAGAAVDFADLILLPIQLLREQGELREALRQKYRWVMVDEYQDVSRSVATLLQELCGVGNPPWVVGDARQAIYRFRGAAPENVELFAEDFPGAEVRSLPWNYRSSTPIVTAANHLAALMPEEIPEGDVPEIWRSAVEVAAVSGPPVVLLEADSDRAEHQAVIELVRAWREGDQAEPGDVAVLARRNIDVRNIALALNRVGISAVTTGLITAEGAAGDLAAVVSWLEAPRSAAARLLFRLGSGDLTPAVRNAAVRHVVSTIDEGGAFPPGEIPEAEALLAELSKIGEDLTPLRFSGDAWDVLCVFLFGRGGYLRDLVTRADDPAAALSLEEILTSLGLAATHRFTHPGVGRRTSRLAFAEHFRGALTQPAPRTLAPRGGANAVRVMTCHASKGLEFPFVVVAGQSLPIRKRGYPWLPESVRPAAGDDALQADALLFVGVTRGKRAVAVSYARTASGLANARLRPLPRLLTRWRDSGAVPLVVREDGPTGREAVQMGLLWGGTLPAALSPYALTSTCVLRTYLEDQLRFRFPPAEDEIYPAFVWRVRRAMQRVVDIAHGRGTPLSPDEAEVLLEEEWTEQFEKHPHLPVFLPRARNWIRAFAAEYDPARYPGEVLEPAAGLNVGGETRIVRGDLVANVATAGGRVAILFRPEVLKLDAKGEAVNWSGLKEAHRLPLVLLWAEDRSLRPFVFSGPAGQSYPYRWKNRNAEEALENEISAVRTAVEVQLGGEFEQTVSEYICDDCPCRISCPVWIGALYEDG